MIAAFLLALATPSFIWIEAERPTSADVKYNAAGWGRPELLSEGKWLHVSIEADKVAKELPAEGGKFTYRFHANQPGDYQLWDRIGFEFARSPFDWRIDASDWKRVQPGEFTTDLTELATWCEVAWLKLGATNLTTGDHTFEVRLPQTKDAKGQPERVLYASDAILAIQGDFHPNGKAKPGESLSIETTAFKVEPKPGPERVEMPLNGTWEIARDDEAIPAKVETPMAVISPELHWSAIAVPSDKNESRPDLIFAHRLWYRTQFDLPQDQKGKALSLTFPQNSLNTTVLVNGKECGFNPDPFCRWQTDITQAVKPGTNELLVGIRDAWYGYSTSPTDPMKLRRSFNLPIGFSHNGFQDLAYPIWGAFQSGILETPVLTMTGAVYADDVFAKPSVGKKSLSVEVTLRNATDTKQTAMMEVVAVNENNKVEWQAPSQTVTLAPGAKTIEASAPWPNPTLWWPDSPHLYRLRVTVLMGEKPIDVSTTPFGFREWGWKGKDFTLNGIVWHGWAELTQGDTTDKWLSNYRATGQRFMRLAGAAQNGGYRWQGMPFERALDWFDHNGVVVRRCGPLDGEAIGYMAIENDPELRKQYGTEVKKQLLDNWRRQMVAQVKGERNHPSIGIWSIENEWLYINCINLYGGLMDDFERETKLTMDAVAAVDPTRPIMTDGGGAGKANLFPVHGDHYVFTNDPKDYPNVAYEPFVDGGGRGRWKWDQQRPRFLGEDYFASGINPGDYAWIQGEGAFQGKAEAQLGMAEVQKMLQEGYRWGGHYGAWHFWIGDEGAKFGKYTPNAERALFVREHDWTFRSGQPITRTFGVFNDSHSNEPLTLTASFEVAGKVVATVKKTTTVAPGTSQKYPQVLTAPTVTTRQSGRLVLRLTAEGKEIFCEVKPLAILPEPKLAPIPGLVVYDPSGEVAALIKVPFTRITTLAKLPAQANVLLIGPNALKPTEAVQSTLAAYALDGHRVVVLDQDNPLHYQGLPVEMESQNDQGAFAFPEDLSHPAFAGLQMDDFRGWPGGDRLYRKSYLKPVSGAKSLLQVGSKLANTALAEIPVGDGLLLVSQVQIAGPVGRQLLANLLKYASTYTLSSRPVVVATRGDSSLEGQLKKIGVRHTATEDPLQTLAQPGVAVIPATPANLARLAANLPKVRAFNVAGGSIVLHGLTPEGLADYNRIVGVDHMIRPFRREKVAFTSPRNPLTTGLSLGDVVLLSGEKIFDWNDDRYVASDTFSYIVDLDDVAPFAKLPSDYHYNTVNGMVSADGWKYIFSFDLNTSKPEYSMEFPKPQEIQEMTWIGNGFYHKVKRFTLAFDGGKSVAFDVAPNTEPQTLTISPPQKGSKIDLKITDWTQEPGVGNVVGIDNISLFASRSPAWKQKVHPMLNVGGLVEYRMGKGRIVLCNLLFKDHEEVPANAQKKLNVLKAILRNLGAGFAAERAIVPGSAHVTYQSVDLSKQANQFLNERGWFGDKETSFRDIPTGRQVFAGVPFTLFEFLTSPVPTAIMLGGNGVPGNLPDRVTGIPLHAKAAALFFLQATRVDGPKRPDEKRVEVARYVIHYEDGQSVTVPLALDVDLANSVQTQPKPLPRAQVAWAKQISDGRWLVAYSKQWNNPRPQVSISMIDLEYGSERRAVPALLAITAAR